MATLTDEPMITPEQLLELNDDKRYELVDGRLVEKKVGYLANRIASVLFWFLENYLRQNHCGIAVCEGSFQNSQNTVRVPDVSVTRAGRFPNGEIPSGHSRIAPDIAVEVISPNELTYDSDRKMKEYLASGVKEVWSANPKLKTIRIKRSNGTSSELDENDILKCEDLLPEFTLKVSEIFQ